jgi:hypothetical protein
MLHPNEARVPVSSTDFAHARQKIFTKGDKVTINWPDRQGEGEVVGEPIEWVNPNGKKVRLVPVHQDRQFWSGNINIEVILVMDVFVNLKEEGNGTQEGQ